MRYLKNLNLLNIMKAKCKGFIYGWRCGDEAQTQLYHKHNEQWKNMVTRDPKDASVFKTIEECQENWKSMHWPGEFEDCLSDGYLQYFEASTFQMVII